jgi:CO/xanthine dehydrogenase FAD-binding subunit
MKPAPFKYLSPSSVDEALQMIEQYGPDAKLLAGGQSLLPAMNFRLLQPSALIDLNQIPSLSYIRSAEGGGLRIGAMTRQSQVEHDPAIAELVPLLHETMPRIAHLQIRNRGTIGGSLVHADPAAELPVVTVALRCQFKLRSLKGSRWVSAPEFFVGMFTTDLQPDEILEEIAVESSPERTGWAFLEVARRSGDYAMAGVAAMLELDESETISGARLVYLNLGDGPVEASQAEEHLLGRSPKADAFVEAGRVAAEEEIVPFGNLHATPEYQRHLAQVLTQRALTQAAERARARR